MLIYIITNSITGDSYIGKTSKTLEFRWRKHITNSATGDTHLYRAIRKYGIEFFSYTVLEYTKDLDNAERKWIACLKPVYNMTNGGEGGDTSTSPRYLEGMKRRDFSGEKNPMFGRRGVDNPNFGKKRTEDQKTKLQQSLCRAWDNNDERRRRMGELIIGFENNRGAQKSAKPIEFEGSCFVSVMDAVRKTGRSAYYIKKTGTFL